MLRYIGFSVRYIIGFIYRIVFFRNVKFNPLNSLLPSDFFIKKGFFYSGNHLRTRSNCSFNVFGGELSIGERVFFNSGVRINCRDSIHIGDDCMFGENIVIYDHDHAFSIDGKIEKNKFTTKSVSIGSGCWIGSGTIILKGVSIGSGSVIASGTIVTKNIDPNTIVIQKRKSIFVSK